MNENKAIWSKLAQAQAELRVPKARTNNFGNYRYRSAEDIQTHLPVLAHLGLFLFITDEIRELAGRHYLVATVRVVDADTGDTAETQGWAREAESKKGHGRRADNRERKQLCAEIRSRRYVSYRRHSSRSGRTGTADISQATKRALFSKARAGSRRQDGRDYPPCLRCTKLQRADRETRAGLAGKPDEVLGCVVWSTEQLYAPADG